MTNNTNKSTSTNTNANSSNDDFSVKVGLAEMLKGGAIMDVTNAEQAKIAEDAGACAVMALERIPSDIRRDGGVARMSDPDMIQQIKDTVSIPVMAKCRIGHFAEAQIIQALEVDFIDESEVLTPADDVNHIYKNDFKVPMIRTKGEAGSGNIIEAVRHMRALQSEMSRLTTLGKEQLMAVAKDMGAPYDLVCYVAEHGELPVPNFSAGGIATPADAALVRQLGAQAVFVGSGIFKSDDPAARAVAIVKATTHYDDPTVLLEVSRGLQPGMKGLEMSEIPEAERLAGRGW